MWGAFETTTVCEFCSGSSSSPDVFPLSSKGRRKERRKERGLMCLFFLQESRLSRETRRKEGRKEERRICRHPEEEEGAKRKFSGYERGYAEQVSG